MNSDLRNYGHGHVRPRPDGVRARCGGPALCKACALEKALARIRVLVERGDPIAMLAVRHLAKAINSTTNDMARHIFGE